MAITINGTGSITGLTAGGLPDGSVVAADLASSLDLTGKTVTLPSGTGGKILQVKNVVKTSVFQSAATVTDTPVTGLSLAITPSSTSNKILVIAHVSCASENNQGAAAKIQRDGSNISGPLADTASNRSLSSLAGSAYWAAVGGLMRTLSINYLDSPSSTSELTYRIVVSSISSPGTFVNRSHTDNDTSDFLRTSSFLTLMEVQG